jgi:hypothetical protein
MSLKENGFLNRGNRRILDRLALSRIGPLLELDQYKIAELKEKGSSSFISSKFYNKGIYRVKNKKTGAVVDFAVNIDKVGAATYEGLVQEMGEDCVDRNLWKDVPEGDVIFFYSLHREDEFVKAEEERDYMVV